MLGFSHVTGWDAIGACKVMGLVRVGKSLASPFGFQNDMPQRNGAWTCFNPSKSRHSVQADAAGHPLKLRPELSLGKLRGGKFRACWNVGTSSTLAAAIRSILRVLRVGGFAIFFTVFKCFGVRFQPFAVQCQPSFPAVAMAIPRAFGVTARRFRKVFGGLVLAIIFSCWHESMQA